MRVEASLATTSLAVGLDIASRKNLTINIPDMPTSQETGEAGVFSNTLLKRSNMF